MCTRSFIYPVLFALIALFGVNSSFSQDVKLAHINRQEILQSMPERQEAKKKMQRFQKELQGNIQKMNKEYQKKLTKFQNKQEDMTNTEKEMKREELSSLQQRITKAQRSAQEDLQKQREELLQPILDKVDKAVKKVAKEKGYTYVFDESSGGIVYKGGGTDITDAVKKELKTGRKGSGSGGGG